MSQERSERPNGAKALMDFGAAMSRLEQLRTDVEAVVDRFQYQARQPAALAGGLSNDEQVRLLQISSNMVNEYTRRTRAYCASIDALLDNFEKELDAYRK